MENENFIEKRVKWRMAFWMILMLCLAGIGLVGCIIRGNMGYVLTFFKGPPEVKNIFQAQELYDSGFRYVSISAEQLYYTDYVVETVTTENGKEKSRKTTSSFWVVDEDDKLFLIELPISYFDDSDFMGENVAFKGFLKKESKDVNILTWASDVIAEGYGVEPQLVRQELIGDLYIDTTSNVSEFVMDIIFIAMLLSGILFFIRFSLCYINPKRHNVYNMMANYGDAEEIEKVIQKEMDDLENSCIVSTKHDYVLKTYTVCTSQAIKVYPTNNLAWVYYRVVKTNGIPTNHFVVLQFADGKAGLQISVKNKPAADAILEKLYNALPVIIGYNKEINKLYRKDRDEFMELWQKTKDDFNARA